MGVYGAVMAMKGRLIIGCFVLSGVVLLVAVMGSVILLRDHSNARAAERIRSLMPPGVGYQCFYGQKILGNRSGGFIWRSKIEAANWIGPQRVFPLDSIYIQPGPFGDSEIPGLLSISGLSHVNVSGSCVTEKGLRLLLAGRNVEEVQCFDCAISSATLEVLTRDYPSKRLLYKDDHLK